MSLLGLLWFVIIVVVVFWLLGKAELEPNVRKWVTIGLVAVFIIWLLEATGVLGGLGLNTPAWRYTR